MRWGAFSATVTHVYALGLILAGPVQLVIVRYASDRINAREKDKIFPSYIAAISVVLPIAAIAGIVLFFGGAAERSLAYRFGGLSMLVFTTAVFITASYLTSFQNYRGLLLGFLLGYGISAAAAYSLGVEAVLRLGAGRLCDWARPALRLSLLPIQPRVRRAGGRQLVRARLLRPIPGSRPSPIHVQPRHLDRQDLVLEPVRAELLDRRVDPRLP